MTVRAPQNSQKPSSNTPENVRGRLTRRPKSPLRPTQILKRQNSLHECMYRAQRTSSERGPYKCMVVVPYLRKTGFILGDIFVAVHSTGKNVQEKTAESPQPRGLSMYIQGTFSPPLGRAAGQPALPQLTAEHCGVDPFADARKRDQVNSYHTLQDGLRLHIEENRALFLRVT